MTRSCRCGLKSSLRALLVLSKTKTRTRRQGKTNQEGDANSSEAGFGKTSIAATRTANTRGAPEIRLRSTQARR